MELLSQRYPDIGFLLSFFPHKPARLPQKPKAMLSWLKTIDLEQIEILYVVGLIGYCLPEKVVNWLDGKKQRALIFIEENLGSFASFSDESLIQNPQVHLIYAQEDPIESLAGDFPSDRVAIFEGKPFESGELIRRSASFSALYSDVLYSHKIVGNVLKNYKRLSSAFDGSGSFEGASLIVCGAGPSLEKTIPILKKYQDRAIILAGGSAITVLTQNGVTPHIAMALDPNDEEYDRLSQAHYFEGPFLFSPRLHRDVFSTSNGPFGYLKSDTGGLIESFLEEQLSFKQEACGPDLGSEAFSVTTLALSWAHSMGFSEIYLAGVDLAFTGNKRYSPGVLAQESDENDPRSLEKRLIRRDIHGKKVETLLKWVMESDCISAFAKNQQGLKIFNGSGEGLGFDGIKNVSLEKKLSKLLSRDLSGMLHQWVQSNPLSFPEEEFASLFKDLRDSLIKLHGLCSEILKELEKKKETGLLALLTSDFHDEIAYRALIEGIDGALEHLLYRYFPHNDPKESNWQRQRAKYEEIRAQINRLLKSFGRYSACCEASEC